MARDSSDETVFPHKLVLTDAQVSWLHKVFANCLSTNIKFSKPQLSMTMQLGRFLLTLFVILLSPPETTKKDTEKKEKKTHYSSC